MLSDAIRKNLFDGVLGHFGLEDALLTRSQHPVIRATVWMSGALLSFMTMAVGARELSGALGTFEILFFFAASSD